jgi:hypothetical protein
MIAGGDDFRSTFEDAAHERAAAKRTRSSKSATLHFITTPRSGEAIGS